MNTPDPYQAIIQDLPAYLQHNPILVQAIRNCVLHGHFSDWLASLNQSLEEVKNIGYFEHLKPIFNQPQVEISLPEPLLKQTHTQTHTQTYTHIITNTLKLLSPWRKGPFKILDIDLQSEWRCNQKYERLEKFAPSIKGKRILDIGSGNGYFGFRMLSAGARQVLNVDPSQLYWCQFQAIKMWQPELPIAQIPLTGEALQEVNLGTFDQVYSMGVLYHRKSPIDHLYLLKDFLKPDGQLVLETLYVDGPAGYSLIPQKTYAKMPNVWFIPTLATLETWLARVGFKDIHCVNTSITQSDEQAKTHWMQNESLEDFLDPENSNLTTEGYPRPARTILIATK